MRIVIDMQGAQTASRFRGIGRYTLALAKAILRNQQEHEVILALSGLFPDTIAPIRAEFRDLLQHSRIRVWETPRPVSEINLDNEWRRKTSERIREAFLASLEPDIVLLTTLFEGYGDDCVVTIREFDQTTPVAVVFYDLIPLLYPETYLQDTRVATWYQGKTEQCKKASLLLSISESSRQEAIQNLKFSPDRITNISTASDSMFQRIEILGEHQEFLTRRGISRPFLLYSGATDWRKNHLRLITAFSLLPLNLRREHQLVIAGGLPPDHREKFLRHAKKCRLKEGELVITGAVSDGEMNVLYNSCTVFVFPSWHEGFGLPALEAMQCGRAVLGSNVSSIPEVIGREDALFDPFDESAISEKITLVLSDSKFRAALETHSIERAKKFSWDISAQRAIKAMEAHWIEVSGFGTDQSFYHNRKDFLGSLYQSISTIEAPYKIDDLRSAAGSIAFNHPNKRPRKVFVDISELAQRDAKTGIQRVVRMILQEWLENTPKGLSIEPVYATKDRGYRYARRFSQASVTPGALEKEEDYLDFQQGDIFIGLDLIHPDIVVSNRTFYQFLRNHGIKVQFIVYDLLPITMPQYSNVGVSSGHERWLEVVCESDEAICISKTVCEELTLLIEEFWPEKWPSLRLSWFHLGADLKDDHEDSQDSESDASIPLLGARPSFLMVGTIEPRKGHAQVLWAFDLLWKSGRDVNLVIVGKQGWMVDHIVTQIAAHPQLNRRLFWLEHTNDSSLKRIYKSSSALIAASEGEGFGLPLIEAARHYLPIIARDIPVFREVAGNCAYYFNTNSSAELAQSIKKWLQLYEDQMIPQTTEMPILTWKESAEWLFEICEDNV